MAPNPDGANTLCATCVFRRNLNIMATSNVVIKSIDSFKVMQVVKGGMLSCY